jgi:hypothetical protein
MNFLSSLTGYFIVNNAKSWAKDSIPEEGYLKNVSSIASAFGALRFFWSFSMQKFSYRQVYGMVLCLQFGCSLILPIALMWV